MAVLIPDLWSRRVRPRRLRVAAAVSPEQVREAHDRLAAELDALLAQGVLLDPVALARLRAAIDAALPAAEAYERRLAVLAGDPAA